MDKNYYYKILGISRSATEDEIKKAYRNLALKYHPDKNKSADAEEIFKRVGVAYRILVDRRKREIYGKMESKRKNTARRNGSDDNDMKNQGGRGNKATSRNHQDSYSKSQKDNCNRNEERKTGQGHKNRKSYGNPNESNYFWNECQTNWYPENRDSDTGRNSFSFFGGSGGASGRGPRGGFFWKNDFQQQRFGFKYERDEETARMRDARKKSDWVGCEKQRTEHFGREKGYQPESTSTRNNAERTRQRAELAREKRQRTKEWKRRTRERAEKFREKWTRNYGERTNVH